MALTPPVVATMHQNAKRLLDLWLRVRLVIIRAFGNAEIDDKQEAEFLELKSEIQRLYRVISDELTRGLLFDGDQMMDLLKNAINIEHLRAVSPKERQKTLSIWHNVYIKLTRTLGALEVIEAGYYPFEHRRLLAVTKTETVKKR
jgi:hypothetical protein